VSGELRYLRLMRWRVVIIQSVDRQTTFRTTHAALPRRRHRTDCMTNDRMRYIARLSPATKTRSTTGSFSTHAAYTKGS